MKAIVNSRMIIDYIDNYLEDDFNEIKEYLVANNIMNVVEFDDCPYRQQHYKLEMPVEVKNKDSKRCIWVYDEMIVNVIDETVVEGYDVRKPKDFLNILDMWINNNCIQSECNCNCPLYGKCTELCELVEEILKENKNDNEN